ncbi:YadA-like family protein [Mycetohabitans sp. B8]|uniref:YadA-like family protein n=1 Tax=Mycetohabitans sp. B8 TaxID=2841845 RepID=UPI001F45386E|nr:YadA-like family protein [Mycetohabitans sp. B8]MCG1042629.1 YadA-like family protein [Mycetohabitans sp. B8]
MTGFYYSRRVTGYSAPLSRRSNFIIQKISSKSSTFSIILALAFINDATASTHHYDEPTLENIITNIISNKLASFGLAPIKLDVAQLDVAHSKTEEKLDKLKINTSSALLNFKNQLATESKTINQKIDRISLETEEQVDNLKNKINNLNQKITRQSNEQANLKKSLHQNIRELNSTVEQIAHNNQSLSNKLNNAQALIQNQINNTQNQSHKYYGEIIDTINELTLTTKNQLTEHKEIIKNELTILENRVDQIEEQTKNHRSAKDGPGNRYKNPKDTFVAGSSTTVSLQAELANANDGGSSQPMLAGNEVRPGLQLTHADSQPALMLANKSRHTGPAPADEGQYAELALANQGGPSERAPVGPGGHAEVALVDPGSHVEVAPADPGSHAEVAPADPGSHAEVAPADPRGHTKVAPADPGGHAKPAPADPRGAVEPMTADDVRAAWRALRDSSGHPGPMLADDGVSARDDIASCDQPAECGHGSAQGRLREFIGADLPSLLAEKLDIHVDDTRVSVGQPGHERRITDVARGTQPTDAVNKAQMDEAVAQVDRNASAGTAAAMAVAGLPQPTLPGKSLMTFASATYRGQYGVALGISHVTPNNRWVLKFAANASSRGYVGMVAAGGFQW